MQSCGGSSFWSGTNWYYFKTNVICNLNVYLGRIPMPPKAQAIPAGTRGQGLRAQECQRRAQRPGRAPSSRVGYFAGGPAGPSRLRLHQGAHLHPIGRRKVKQMQPILVFLFIALFFFFFFFFCRIQAAATALALNNLVGTSSSLPAVGPGHHISSASHDMYADPTFA